MSKHKCKQLGMGGCEECMDWRVKLWDAVNEYVVACGGNPRQGVGSPSRMQAVVEVEGVVVGASLADQIR